MKTLDLSVARWLRSDPPAVNLEAYRDWLASTTIDPAAFEADVARANVRPPQSLNARFAAACTQPGRYSDGRDAHGLALLVKPKSGGGFSRSWTQRIFIGGKVTNLGLGAVADVSLAEARCKAAENHAAARRGEDPRGERKATKSFEEVAWTAWQDAARGKAVTDKTLADKRARLRNHGGPLLARRIDTVTRADLRSALEAKWAESAALGNKLLKDWKPVFVYAAAEGLRADNPLAGIRPSDTKVTHRAAVPYNRVPAVLSALEGMEGYAGPRLALRFLVLTGCRSGEARGATWGEMEGATWTIPAERTKTGAEHRVPLSEAALATLAEAKALGGELVFPSARGKVMTDARMLAVLKAVEPTATVHGFRSSFRDWCAESGVQGDVAESALGHAVRNQVEAAYRRTDYFEARRALMERWGTFCGQD